MPSIASILVAQDAGAPFLRFLGRIHPSVVHFPVALLLVAAGIELVRRLRRRPGPSEAAFVCLSIGALSALVAAGCGWLNATYEPHPKSLQGTLSLHRWAGIATASIASVTWFLARAARRGGSKPWIAQGHAAGLCLCALLVGAAGHLGGTLVYGEGYLTEVFEQRSLPAFTPAVSSASVAPADPAAQDPLPAAVQSDPQTAIEVPPDPQPADPGPVEVIGSPPLATARRADFAHDVWPILQARCFECHGPKKKKGNMRLDNEADLFRGEPESWVIQRGDSAKSEMYRRITLPADDPDLMPNKGEKLSEEQIALIKDWIDQGAPWSSEVGVAPPEDVSSRTDGDAPEGSSARAEDEARARERVLAAIRERGGSARRIGAHTPDVEVDLSRLGAKATGADLVLLRGLEATLAWLDLSRTGIRDQDLADLGPYGRLRQLELADTSIGDPGLELLAELDGLEVLDLSGTRIGDAGLRRLRHLPALRRLRLERVRVSEAAISELRAALPRLSIERDDSAGG